MRSGRGLKIRSYLTGGISWVKKKWKSRDINISTARFANVAFSDGSLLHGFNQRILKNQPISAPKRDITRKYKDFFSKTGIEFVTERPGTRSNYWLNAVKFKSLKERNEFLEYSNNNGIMTRPVWSLMNRLKMYKDCFSGSLGNTKILEEQIVNIPSGVI